MYTHNDAVTHTSCVTIYRHNFLWSTVARVTGRRRHTDNQDLLRTLVQCGMIHSLFGPDFNVGAGDVDKWFLELTCPPTITQQTQMWIFISSIIIANI